MKTFCIALPESNLTELRNSSNLEIETFSAVLPFETTKIMRKKRLRWTYPWESPRHDLSSGLYLTPYATKVKEKRIACFLSHLQLWENCVEDNVPYIILEQDAVFQRKFEHEQVLQMSDYHFISLNEPQRGATPKADVYRKWIEENYKGTNGVGIAPVPYVRPTELPAGLPGHSAYYIKPEGAKKMLHLVKRYGCWPNDSIMCKQLLPKQMGCLYPFITKVKKGVSTTTL